MKKKILMTRPAAASQRWASLLAQHDYECVIEPLLRIETLPNARPAGLFQAVMFTSTNAPEALLERGEALADLLALPCFCVGPSTAAAARAFGFSDVRSGASDSGALAELAIAQLTDKNAVLLHVCGEAVETKAYETLARAGLTVAAWPIYRASPADDFSTETVALFLDDVIDVVPVFSPRSARILVSLIEKNRLTPHCYRVTAIGLSQAVADVLQTLPWRRLRVAAAPREDEVLACLQLEAAMPEPQSTESAAPVLDLNQALPGRFKLRLMWYVFGLLVLVGAGIVPFVYYHFFEGDAGRPVPPHAALVSVVQPEVPVAPAPENTIEAEHAAATATTVVVPAPVVADHTGEIAALNETVKTLQAQLAQIQADRTNGKQAAQSAAQNWAAAALVFWEARTAAREGRAFAAPLAQLRQLTSGSADISRSVDLLLPYATTGVVSLPQLRTDLAAIWPKLSAPTEEGEGPVWLARVRASLRALVNIHSVRNDVFVPLSGALEKGDVNAAAAAFAALPDWAKAGLADWSARFEAHRAVAVGLDALAAAFVAPPTPSVTGNAP